MPDLDFVAVDFETANGERESACAVGVTVVRNGQVQSSDSWLIMPPPSADHFERRNTAIHGITREQCMADGLPWPETAQRLNRLCADLPVVAHNASFDESVWRAANRVSGVESPLPRFHCTLQLSRGHLDLVDHKLPTVVRHLGLDDFPHHQAEADALAAAQVTVELARRTGTSTVEELWGRAPHRSSGGSSSGCATSSPRVPESVFRTSVEPSPAPYAAPPRQPWDPPPSVRPRQPWDPPLPAAAPAVQPRRRWKFHLVMWSIMLFLVVGMLIVGLLLDLAGAPESVWGPVVGISWLVAPLVFAAWLVVTVVRLVKGRQ